MANELHYWSASTEQVDITGWVFQPDGTERDFGAGDAGIAMVDTGHAGIYLGDCSLIQAGDYIMVKDNATIVDVYQYKPALYELQGPGVYAHTLVIRDTSSAPVAAGVEVWVNSSNTRTGSITTRYYTDSNGQVIVYLNYGTYYVFCDSDDYTFIETGTSHRIISSAGTVSFNLDIATAVAAEGSSAFYDESFLSRAIAQTRENVDEPSANVKYTDASLITRIENAYAMVLAEVNRNTTEPIVAKYNVSVTSSASTFVLPPNIGSIIAVYTGDDNAGKVFYNSRSPYNTWGRSVWIEGKVLHVAESAFSEAKTLVIEYIPSGTARLHNGTCTVDSTGKIITLGATPNNGTLDTTINAYGGSVLRLLGSSESSFNSIQERTISSYDYSTRQITLTEALDPIPTSGTTYYEIAPAIWVGLDMIIGLYVARQLLSVEGNTSRLRAMDNLYREALRNLHLSSFYSNYAAVKLRYDNYDNRRYKGI